MAKEKTKKKGDGAKPEETAEFKGYEKGYRPRLLKRYGEEIAPALKKRFNYDNGMMVPRLTKIVVNMGLGAAVANPKIIDTAREDMRLITGQQPVVRRSRKSIAGFKLRAGLPIGMTVTLRKNRMWEFADRFLNVALPRVRDFKGVSPKGFDGRGNYTVGIREQIIFPEIDYDKVDAIRGLNVSFVTTAPTDEEGRELLKLLGMPFRGMTTER
ncbi:MAG TPA: 50S ribosomal protein L5 [Polyangiaceae bacterium]|jgi:large subunit ribosomal protein L5|nr:50S ribosomal protein L5 [Polyangiaceae bacterium]